MTNLTSFEAQVQHAVDAFRSQIAALQGQWAKDQRRMNLRLEATYRREPSLHGARIVALEVCKLLGRVIVFEWRRHRLLRSGRKLETTLRSASCKDPTP